MVPVDDLLSAADDTALMMKVYQYGVDAVEKALFDEGLRVQVDDPDRALACMAVFDRIRARTRP